MLNTELEKLLDQTLQSFCFKDYSPNGLQVEGRKNIKKIVTGVTACQALIDAAIKLEADAILVHHGYFWANEPAAITGMKYRRLKKLLTHDINLFAYHLPLDAHAQLGNNAQIAKRLGIDVYPRENITELLFLGEFPQALSSEELIVLIEEKFNRTVLYSAADDAPIEIKNIAWCSGGGQNNIEAAAKLGVDAFLTGEVSEQTIHIAREYGMHFFAAGHHATERYGIKALGKWLEANYDLDVTFVDIDNPA